MLVAITCTTMHRQIPMKYCMTWMARQTRFPDRWIVVSDGPVAWLPSIAELVIRPRQEPGHTMCRNLITALSLLGRTEKVVIFEDDDWYAPDWLATCDHQLDKYHLFGEAPSTYYDVRHYRYLRCGNKDHASLCQTAFRGDLIPFVMQLAIGDQPYGLDEQIWQKAGRWRHRLATGNCVVGIKGLPGCDVRSGRWIADDGSILESLVGADAQIYRDMGK